MKVYMVNKMKKKITALCSVMIALSICIAMLCVNGTVQNDITTATAKVYYAQKSETTTNALSGILGGVVGGLDSGSSSDKIDSVIDSIEGVSGDIDSALDNLGGFSDSLGGIGDAFSGMGDSFGDVFGGIGDSLGGVLGGFGGSGSGTTVKTTAPATTSADIGLIIPVPAATQTPSETQAPSTADESTATGETVDYAATSNPYTKPTSTFSAGDEDETIKWLQWIFVYTGYGLKDDGITGVLDEDTVAVVKKLQHENKMTVDGNITEEVIKAAEVLYYQSMLGEDVSAIEISSDITTGEGASNSAGNGEEENDIPVALLIVVLVIIWVLAIGGIVLLFLFKKKKMNAVKNAAAEKTETKESGETGDNSIKSLSDLFEEAENKDK